LLHKKAIGAGEQFPVDVLGRFTGVVKPVLGKFNRETMKRTSVQTGYKAFDYLFRDKFKVIELLKLLDINKIIQGICISPNVRQLKLLAKDIAFKYIYPIRSGFYPLPFAFRQRIRAIDL